MHQLILNFTTLIRVSTPFSHSRENFVFVNRQRFSESSQIFGQAKTRQLNFIVIVNIHSCGKFLSSPVLYTNSKYISFVWTVVCLCILTSRNISEIYMTAYFEYLSDILHALHIHFPSTSYHLTW